MSRLSRIRLVILHRRVTFLKIFIVSLYRRQCWTKFVFDPMKSFNWAKHRSILFVRRNKISSKDKPNSNRSFKTPNNNKFKPKCGSSLRSCRSFLTPLPHPPFIRLELHRQPSKQDKPDDRCHTEDVLHVIVDVDDLVGQGQRRCPR